MEPDLEKTKTFLDKWFEEELKKLDEKIESFEEKIDGLQKTIYDYKKKLKEKKERYDLNDWLSMKTDLVLLSKKLYN